MSQALRAAVLVVSDRSASGEREDASGPALAEALRNEGWEVVQSAIVEDERTQIASQIAEWADSGAVDLILTTGGTGFSPRDVTPEATHDVIERAAPGLAEAIRARSLKVTPHAMLSRASAGLRGGAVIVNLPGSPRGAVEGLRVVLPALPHAVQVLQDRPSIESGHQPPRKPAVA